MFAQRPAIWDTVSLINAFDTRYCTFNLAQNRGGGRMTRLACLSFATCWTTNLIKKTVNRLMSSTALNIQSCFYIMCNSCRPTSRFIPPRSTRMIVMFNDVGIMIRLKSYNPIGNLFKNRHDACKVYFINQQINQIFISMCAYSI